MHPFEEYRGDARQLSDRAFAGMYGELFLVKPPASQPARPEIPWHGDVGFETQGLDARSRASSENRMLDEAFRHSWRACPVRKRPGGAFPTRISVGRARSCDVVLRLTFVSKVHAHFVRDVTHPALKIVDLGSANGTRVNDRPLIPAVETQLRLGDEIAFGEMVCRLVGAATFRSQVLRHRAEAGPR